MELITVYIFKKRWFLVDNHISHHGYVPPEQIVFIQFNFDYNHDWNNKIISTSWNRVSSDNRFTIWTKPKTNNILEEAILLFIDDPLRHRIFGIFDVWS